MMFIVKYPESHYVGVLDMNDETYFRNIGILDKQSQVDKLEQKRSAKRSL